MAHVEADGRTTREHLESVARRSPSARKELVGPPLPGEWVPLWDAFLELHRWRGVGGMGSAPLTLRDIEVWERRFFPEGMRFSPTELDMLKRLDTVALTEGK